MSCYCCVLNPLSLLHPVRAVFSNAIMLFSSLDMRDQVTCPYKTIGKTIVLYISLSYSWIGTEKMKDSRRNGKRHCLALALTRTQGCAYTVT